MPKRKMKKLKWLAEMTIEDRAEAEARRIARDSGFSEGLWELFLTDAYRRIAGIDRKDRNGGDEGSRET